MMKWLIGKIKYWLSEQKSKQEYKGYSFAMTKWRRGEITIRQLEDYVETAQQFGDYDEFDRGIDRAIQEIWETQHGNR